MKGLLSPGRPSRLRIAVVGTLAAAIAVGISRILGPHNLAAGTALCLLAVVIASAMAGRTCGLLASLLSFFGLNYFFTEPRHTLAVHHLSDLVALFAFLVSAVIVGTLLSRALEERSRAEQRATEAQLLSRTTARLISGDPFDRIFEELSSALLRFFELIRCEIVTDAGVGIASTDDQPPPGPSIEIPLATEGLKVGTLTATRAIGSSLFTSSEVQLLESLASQTALAVERVALDREVRRAKLEAETSSLRAALFSSVTHDLRTPLSSIKASATGLIAEGADYTDAQREEMARTVIEEADHLNQIVGNLLDLARMRAGALIPARRVIYLEDVIASALRRMHRSLDGFVIRTNIRPQMPPVEADPIQIEQVLTNLLENATRFSPKGSEISISVAAWRTTIRTLVSDRGPGIPETDRESVFDEFFSRDSGLGRGGTGLGLAIARAVVVAHGGRIWAQTAPGGGTTIAFEIPASDAIEAEPEQEKVSSS